MSRLSKCIVFFLSALLSVSIMAFSIQALYLAQSMDTVICGSVSDELYRWFGGFGSLGVFHVVVTRLYHFVSKDAEYRKSNAGCLTGYFNILLNLFLHIWIVYGLVVLYMEDCSAECLPSEWPAFRIMVITVTSMYAVQYWCFYIYMLPTFLREGEEKSVNIVVESKV